MSHASNRDAFDVNLFSLRFLVAGLLLSVVWTTRANAQLGGMGGGGMGGGGMGGMGGQGGPAGPEKPRFRDIANGDDELNIRREQGDQIIGVVNIVGNRRVAANTILQTVRSRTGRYYDYETVLADVRRLNEMGHFDDVRFRVIGRNSDGTPVDPNTQHRVTRPPGDVVDITYTVRERTLISAVHYHGNRALNDRELAGRSGIKVGDPLNEFPIGNGRLRMLDFYRSKAFPHATIETQLGLPDDPTAVVYHIDEGLRERVQTIEVIGVSDVSESRLKKIINTRGRFLNLYPWGSNTADMDKIDGDSDVLSRYLADLGYLEVVVGRQMQYRPNGKDIDLTFVVEQGPRYKVGSIQIVGNQFISESSIRERLKLHAGDFYNGQLHRVDVTETTFGYGEQGFIYAEVEPRTIMRDDEPVVDLVYSITEGDRWVAREVRIDIEGDPYLMRETTMLNMVDLREGDFINLRDVEINRGRLLRSNLFETDPSIADSPDIQILPIGQEPGARR